MTIFKEITFEAAHFLPHVPEGHKCRRMHGHSYIVQLFVAGKIDERVGWVLDFGDLKEIAEPVINQLDHHCLNDISGLENPTCEILARWIWSRLRPLLPPLSKIVVKETPTSGCVYRGEDE
ncbi:MAG TPA: 6-carboxytetrahydropterin synthase QueD [Bacteroidota bacterium]|nr:6-carboxytetrahydropterin synthase QueD [Bacteroidota bacterium]